VVELLQAPERIALDIQQVPWPIPPIEGDRELLLMVFRNLADNALKYSPPDSKVQIRARHTSGALVVEVIDTGRGIQPDELPLVAEELYRGSNTRDVAGSGLGPDASHPYRRPQLSPRLVARWTPDRVRLGARRAERTVRDEYRRH